MMGGLRGRILRKNCEMCDSDNFMIGDAIYLIRIKPATSASAAMFHIKFAAAIGGNGEFLQKIATRGTGHNLILEIK